MYIEPDDPLQFTGKIYQTDMASHLKKRKWHMFQDKKQLSGGMNARNCKKHQVLEL